MVITTLSTNYFCEDGTIPNTIAVAMEACTDFLLCPTAAKLPSGPAFGGIGRSVAILRMCLYRCKA